MADNACLQRCLLDALGDKTCLTVDELVSSASLSRKQVSEAATKLISRGYVERVERGCFRLTTDGRLAKHRGIPLSSGPTGPHTGPAKPRRNTFRRRLWRAMRLKKKFTIGDIVALAASGDEKNPESNAQTYLKKLCNSGHVFELSRRLPGTALTSNGHKQYSLVRDTGELAPVIRARGARLFDPNTGEEVSCQR